VRKVLIVKWHANDGEPRYMNRYFDQFGEVPSARAEDWARDSYEVVELCIGTRLPHEIELTPDGFLKM